MHAGQEKDLTIIIPAYNEEDRIGPTLSSLIEHIDNLKEILVIFDGNDRTEEISESYGEKVRVLRYKRRLGKGGAIVEGFKEADSSVVCYIDADGSSPWYEVAKVCSYVNDDVPAVIGSRWVNSSKIIKKEPLFNVIAGRGFNFLVRSILGLKINDTQCGLKAFRGDVAKTIAQKVWIKDRTIDVAILYHLKLLGIEPLEVGVIWSHNEDTKLPIKGIIFLMFLTVIGLRMRHSRRLKGQANDILKKVRERLEFY